MTPDVALNRMIAGDPRAPANTHPGSHREADPGQRLRRGHPLPNVVLNGQTPAAIVDMLATCAHASDMSKMVQIRHVPDAPHRASAIRATAGAWARFRARRLDPHELAWAVTETSPTCSRSTGPTGPTGRPRSPALRRADPVELVLAP